MALGRSFEPAVASGALRARHAPKRRSLTIEKDVPSTLLANGAFEPVIPRNLITNSAFGLGVCAIDEKDVLSRSRARNVLANSVF